MRTNNSQSYLLVKEAAQAAKHENASANAGEQVAQDAQRRRGIIVRRERFESLYRLQGSATTEDYVGV